MLNNYYVPDIVQNALHALPSLMPAVFLGVEYFWTDTRNSAVSHGKNFSIQHHTMECWLLWPGTCLQEIGTPHANLVGSNKFSFKVIHVTFPKENNHISIFPEEMPQNQHCLKACEVFHLCRFVVNNLSDKYVTEKYYGICQFMTTSVKVIPSETGRF